MAVKRFSTSFISESGQDKSSNFIAGYSPAIDEMDLIQRVTVGSGGTSSITFSNIPQTYQHLQLRLIGRTSPSAANITLRFNGDTSNSYTYNYFEGNGSIVSAGNPGVSLVSAGTVGVLSADSNIFTASITDIIDYTSTNKNKVSRSNYGFDRNGSNTWMGFLSNLWVNNAAIISISLSATNIEQYSTASLYGVKA